MATLSTAARTAAAQAIADLLNAGSGQGRTVLTTYAAGFSLALASAFVADSHPAFAAASSGSSTAPPRTALASVAVAGTVSGYALYNRDSALVFSKEDGVGDVGSGAEFEMNVRAVVVGQRYAIGAITITMPES